jgi:PAS domain S-box-containing protein
MIAPPEKRKSILRELAEQQLVDGQAPKYSPHPREMLVHELQVHQIELEMQNEALRQAQVDLEASRDHYVDLYEFAPLGYLTLSGSGMIEQINLTGATLLGAERKPLLQRRFDKFVATEDQDRWQRLFMKMKQLGEKMDIELTLQRINGTRFPARLDCQYLEGDAPRVRIAVTDITDSKRISEELARERELLDVVVKQLAEARDVAEAANRAKSAFLANMSHEIRTPLNAITGIGQLVRRAGVTQQQADWLDKVDAAGGHLLEIINAILDLSKIEAGKLMLEDGEVDINRVTRNVAAMLDDRA